MLNVEFEPQPMPNKGGMIGIDVGIKEFYSDSNGNVVANPKYLEKSMRKLVREQRKLSRKQKGSNNRNKQRVKVALVHEKITNQRNDFLQKQSTILIRENQTICIEDLKVKNMMRNHKLAQHIGSASWSKFFDMLAYKAVWYGNDVVKVPTMYPSSQTYSDFEDERCAISLDGEYRNNGFPNDIPFERGTVAMGGEGNVASGSCFFITLTDEAGKRLDGGYAAFGKVIEGWEVVEQITALPTEKVDIGIPGVDVNEPIEPEYMEKVIVETWGVEYDEPVFILSLV